MTVSELQNYLDYLVQGKSVRLTTEIAISCGTIIKPLRTADLVVEKGGDNKFDILWIEMTRHPQSTNIHGEDDGA